MTERVLSDHVNRALDRRTEFARDHDRVLYASAFRRLSGVTQVTSPTGDVVHHDRLTHSLKVAQVARRIGETLPGVDPEVPETAAMAHDLGHPPFGHAGEQELGLILLGKIDRDGNQTADPPYCADGFEGNAQTFRIVTRTAARNGRDWGEGLNLTLRTVAALIKYPWARSAGPEPFARLSEKKWGAYEPDVPVMRRALQSAEEAGLMGSHRPVEAQIMDWADDVSYGVHDSEDYFRAGQIPLHELAHDEALWAEMLDFAHDEITPKLPILDEGAPISATVFRNTFEEQTRKLRAVLPLRRYDGGRAGREAIHRYGSKSIETLLRDLTIDSAGDLAVPLSSRVHCEILKAMTTYFVIQRADLQFAQVGQRRVLRELFFDLLDRAEAALGSDGAGVKIPTALQDYCELALTDRYPAAAPSVSGRIARGVTDFICSLTDRQAESLAAQLRGRP